ncbi:brg1-associated factor b [Ephemerocybe angulata]|uniref:Brg1-associated factor b n=1 Tax=Ephemerocybe angulata TaxID=980116 RepID=A0A8H6IC56_9AGAR|nr:brg1-associated factor b [Tulosesus angulatus]
MVNYGGDEVSALVIDIGTSSLRAGYAGDDTPKAIIPTYYGYTPPTPDADVSMTDGTEGTETSSNKPKPANTYIGQNGPSIWRPNMEIGNPLADGLITNFDPIPPLIRHALEDVMRVDATEHPVLNRERMAEIMFEEFNVPAFYIANTGVLNAFASGKGSALVVDIGQSMASVTPVVDGFVLRKGSPSRPGEHWIRPGTEPVDVGHPPRYTLREERVAQTTESWKIWAENREIDEWLQSVGALTNVPRFLSRAAPKQYEFPTGYATTYGAERYQVSEHFFISNHNSPDQPKTLPGLITESLRACDPDLRQVLTSNIAKIHAPGNPIERRYGGWLGGSILASLGTFHQLWISKEEWQEHGKAIVGQRCK